MHSHPLLKLKQDFPEEENSRRPPEHRESSKLRVKGFWRTVIRDVHMVELCQAALVTMWSTPVSPINILTRNSI